MKFSITLVSLFTFIFFIVCSGCKRNDPITTYGKLKIVWRESFNNDQLYGSSTPVIHNDKAIFSNYPAFGSEPFFALNADKGGSEIWRWEDYINQSDLNIGSGFLPITYNNVMCLTPANGMIGVDMQTGKTLWKQNFSSPGRARIFERSAIRQGQDGTSKAYLKLVDIETGNSKTVFEIDTLSSPFFSFTDPTAYRDGAGDTILYFSFGQLFQQPDGSIISKGAFYAYNITTKSVTWKKDNLVGSGIVDGDNLYVASDSLYCFDLKTGKRIWANLKDSNTGRFIQIEGDKILITGDGANSHIQAFNKSTGEFIWGVPFNGGASEPVYHKGLMYFTCGSDGLLWAIRVSNGQVVWKERCPDTEQDPDSFWSFGVNVDPIRDKLYVASYSGAFCLEPAE